MQYRAERKLNDRQLTLRCETGTANVVLRDISTSGLKVQCSSPLLRGMRVTLDLLGQSRSANVVWSRGASAGLKLDTPLTATELAAIHRPCDPMHLRSGRWNARQNAQRFSELR